MNIAIDLDGVVCDYHKGFVRAANSIWPGRLSDGPPPEWEMTSYGLTEREVGQVMERIRSTPNWWMSLSPLYANVSAVLQHRVRHPDDVIFYVTARHAETEGLPIFHQSHRWLEMCGLGGVGTALIVVPPDVRKVDIYEKVGVEYAVDDSLDIVAEGAHIIYLLDQPYNQTDRPASLDVVDDLKDFFKTIRRDNVTDR